MINNVSKFGRIGVLMGGYSSEREISLKSGKAIFDSLSLSGADVVALDIIDSDENKIKKFIMDTSIDIAFIALHGSFGEDGKVQAILENLNILYPGSGVKASKIAINKILTQNLLRKKGINVAKSISVFKKNILDIDLILKEFDSLPVVVKPACEGSSIGITIVHYKEELEAALIKAWQYGNDAIVEKFIKGREMTVGILAEEALPVVEIISNNTFFDFTAKYNSKGETKYIVPAQIPKEVSIMLQRKAVMAHKAIGCRDFSRIDFILTEDMKEYVLEINTIPGFTSTSLLPKAASAKGINFDQLCVKLLELSYGKKKENQNTSVCL